MPSSAPGSVRRGQRRVHGSKARHRPGEAEVEDLDRAVFGEEQVLGFQIAVDDDLLVRGGQPQGDPPGDLGGAAERDRAPVEPLPQCLALQKLHDRESDSRLAAEIVDRENVRVRQGGDRAGLVLKAGEGQGVGGRRLGEDFDRDVARKLEIPGPVDLAHSARADTRHDLVGSEARAGGQCQQGSCCGDPTPTASTSSGSISTA